MIDAAPHRAHEEGRDADQRRPRRDDRRDGAARGARVGPARRRRARRLRGGADHPARPRPARRRSSPRRTSARRPARRRSASRSRPPTQLLAALEGSMPAAAVNLPFSPAGRKSEPFMRLGERLGLLAAELARRQPAAGRGRARGPRRRARRADRGRRAQGRARSPPGRRGQLRQRRARRGRAAASSWCARAGAKRATTRTWCASRLSGEGGKVDLAGLVVGEGDLRVVEFLGYRLEFRPNGRLLVLENRDVPGVVGRIGTTLGEAGVNIAEIHLSRHEDAGEALAVLRLDQTPERADARAAARPRRNLACPRRRTPLTRRPPRLRGGADLPSGVRLWGALLRAAGRRWPLPPRRWRGRVGKGEFRAVGRRDLRASCATSADSLPTRGCSTSAAAPVGWSSRCGAISGRGALRRARHRARVRRLEPALGDAGRSALPVPARGGAQRRLPSARRAGRELHLPLSRRRVRPGRRVVALHPPAAPAARRYLVECARVLAPGRAPVRDLLPARRRGRSRAWPRTAPTSTSPGRCPTAGSPIRPSRSSRSPSRPGRSRPRSPRRASGSPRAGGVGNGRVSRAPTYQDLVVADALARGRRRA